MYHPEALAPIITFLREIGIGVEVGDGGRGGFLSGVNIHAGVIHVHPETLAGSGDLLHEAGHIAIVPQRFRAQLGSDLQIDTDAAIAAEAGSTQPDDPVMAMPILQGEFMAQAWSYAAALHLGLPPACIFFPGSYKHTDYTGAHPMQLWLESGTHYGPNALARAGMTGFSGLFAFMGENGLPPFPHMTRWVQA